MQIRVVAKDHEKAGITVSITSTLEGEVLPLQCIYTGTGTTERSKPKGEARRQALQLGFVLDATNSHWQTQPSAKRYFDGVSCLSCQIADLMSVGLCMPATTICVHAGAADVA